MLATMVDKPFDKEGWQYEIKWDGYWTVAFCNENSVELRMKSAGDIFKPVLGKGINLEKVIKQFNKQ